jgi:hypothetical protein
MNRTITPLVLVLVASLATCAVGADVELSVLSNGQRAIRVPPGTIIEFVISAERLFAIGDSSTRIDAVEVSARIEGADEATPVATRPLRIPTAGQQGRFPVSLGAVAGPDAPGLYKLRLVSAEASLVADGVVAQAEVAIRNELSIEIAENALAVVGSDPPADSIDARQPGSPDGARIDGWDRVDLRFSGDARGLTPVDFGVEHTASGRAPQVERVIVDGSLVTLELDAVVTIGAWTRITHVGSGTGVRLGHLPGDVNASRRVTAHDILALLDALDGAADFPVRQTDMDRNGRVDSNDVVRLLDLINGWGGYAAFLDQSLPDD